MFDINGEVSHSRYRAHYVPLQANFSSGGCESSNSTTYDAVAITLSLPFWTFITFYLLILIIHYLRSLQYFTLYDRCTPKQAHFRYDFHIVTGRYSTNYNVSESNLIVDLLDNQLISTMTIQVPGSSIFNDHQVFMYRHTRPNMRCMSFTIYRRHPIKDVRCIRVAHSCNNPESRLFVYGINLRDLTNAESKFFPITSVVKYRGTQWALNTTFEPKPDLSFSKIGCNCYDPFGLSTWPSYTEILLLIFYIWCASLCFGSLVPIESLQDNLILHTVVITFIVSSTGGVITFFYLKLIKTHVVDEHYDSYLWHTVSVLSTTLVLALCFAFWFLALRELVDCKKNSIEWIISSGSCSLLLSMVCIIALFIMARMRRQKDSTLLEEYEGSLMKTNSKTNIDFVAEVSPGPLDRTKMTQQVGHLPTKKHGSKSAKTSTGANRKLSSGRKKRSPANKGSNETMDTALTGSGYLKTKNRNSIAQYV